MLEIENRKLELNEIDYILKKHGVEFSRCGGHYWIKEDNKSYPSFHVKAINSIEKIRNFLGY